MVIFSFRVCKSTLIYLLNELWTALGVWRRIFIFHTWKLTNECLFFNKLVNFQHPRPPLLFSICLRLTMGSLKSFVLHFDWKATKFWSPSWYFGLHIKLPFWLYRLRQPCLRIFQIQLITAICAFNPDLKYYGNTVHNVLWCFLNHWADWSRDDWPPMGKFAKYLSLYESGVVIGQSTTAAVYPSWNLDLLWFSDKILLTKLSAYK